MNIRYIGTTDTQVKWGSNTDPRKILILNYMYEVNSIEVHSYHTKIALKGIQGWFNSTSFINPKTGTNEWLEPYLEKWNGRLTYN